MSKQVLYYPIKKCSELITDMFGIIGLILPSNVNIDLDKYVAMSWDSFVDVNKRHKKAKMFYYDGWVLTKVKKLINALNYCTSEVKVWMPLELLPCFIVVEDAPQRFLIAIAPRIHEGK
jgi:hypothetical protein